MKNLATRPALILALGVLFITLAFAIFTQHAWEDFWITYRASRNLATGHGLVFTPGERLHTFTSPIGALLPAFFCWLTHNQSDALVLWLFRLTSIAALAAGMVLIYSMLKALSLRPASCWLTLALIGLDAKVVDFSINGMETGLLIFFLALTLHGLLVDGPRQPLRLGVGWAGLMWSRPDSFVYVAILAAGTLLFFVRKKTGKPPGAWIKMFFFAGIISAILYLPWVLWAASYYGSPIPHTIVAKATNKPPIHLKDLLEFPLQLSESSLVYDFMPAYSDQGWPQLLIGACNALALVAALAWPVFILRPQTRLFSLACFLGNFYLTAILRYYPPWYLPTAAIFGYLALGMLFDELLGWFIQLQQRGKLTFLPGAFKAAAVVLVLGELTLTLCVAWELKWQQQIIETGLRKQIGLWLRDHAASPRDTVMLEPLGYIGYYSGLKMYDYPGLASKEMVETRKRLGPARDNQAYLTLKPDWLVLRPFETTSGHLIDPAGLAKYYEQVKTFDVSDKVSAIRWLPGRAYLHYDQTFIIYHRKPDVDGNTNPPSSKT